MKKEKIVFGVMLVCTFLLSGCAQKHIRVQSIAPAHHEKALQYKRLSVLPISNDVYAQGGMVEEKLLDASFQQKPLFKLITHQDIPALKDISRIKTPVKEVDALVSIQLDSPVVYDTPFYLERLKCGDSTCKYMYTYYMPCIQRDYTVLVHFRMIDAQSGDLILSKNISQTTQHKACETPGYTTLPNTEWILKGLHEESAKQFVAFMSPTYYAVSARFATEETDIALTAEAKKYLEIGMDALKEQYIDKAQSAFEKVLELSEGKSYVATHNLGLVYEAKGAFTHAYNLFETCTHLVKNPKEHLELQLSLERIRQTLFKEAKVFEQTTAFTR